MKKLFLVTILNFTNVNSMTNSYNEIKEVNIEKEQKGNKGCTSILYMIATFASAINLGLVIYNYVDAPEENKNFIGLILNGLDFIFNIGNILINIFSKNIKLVILNILSFIYTYLLLHLLYFGFAYENLYGAITGSSEYNLNVLGMISLYKIIYMLTLTGIFLQNTNLRVNEIMCVLCLIFFI